MSGAVVLVVACGGESQRRVMPARDEPGSAAGADAGLGSEADAAGHEDESAVVNPLPDCVPTDRGDEGSDAMTCPPVSVTIQPRVAGPVCAPGGITVEPLQVPDFPPPWETSVDRSTEQDPAQWDRSELPAGAYVVRLHGVKAACYPLGGIFLSATCNVPTLTRSQSFYEQFCSVEPGCPTASNVPDPTVSNLGAWWYVAARGENAVDLVVCAPLVVNYMDGGCLVLDAERRCSGL